MASPVAQVMAMPIAQQLLHNEPILHLSYTGKDGGPRVIPIGYVWDGDRFRMWTIPTSAKVRALSADPRVAITVDIPGPPPRVLLVRGRASLTVIDGVPDGEEPVVAQDAGFVLPERMSDPLALFGVDDNPGEVVEEPVVPVERTRVLGQGIEQLAE